MSPSPRLHALGADLRDLLSSDARLYRLARIASVILVPLTLAIVALAFGTGPEPRRNWLGDFIGNDFAQVWVVGQSALRGAAAEPYDLPRHLENLRAAFGPECRFAWHYPPVLHLPAAALALLSPQVAYLVFAACGLALFAAALRLAGGATAMLIGCAHPLVFCNLTYGQNGLYTAALLTLGALLCDRRPWLAGFCFGLVCYKPQLAALAPCLLLVTGRRACLAACLATIAGLSLAALAAFGTAPWLGFIGTLGETNRIILQNAAAGLDLNASAFGAVRLAGGGMAAAWTLQIAASLAALVLAWRVWAVCPDHRLRAATLLAAAAMLSPYVPVYDLAPLVPATALLVVVAVGQGGLRPYERGLLVATPLAAATMRLCMDATGVPLGLLLALATLGCVLARALPEGLGMRRALAA